MTQTRLALPLSSALPLALLALAACGDGQGEASKREDGPSAPLGFELAMMGSASAANPDANADNVPAASEPSPMVDLSPDELTARIRSGNIRLIDVRNDSEVAEGVILGAEHIPLDRFDPAKLDLSDGREVVLYCRSGRRSVIAGEKLSKVTGAPVEHLAGGVLAWEAAGQPLAPE